MSKRHCEELMLENIETGKEFTVKIVYYTDQIICPECKGEGISFTPTARTIDDYYYSDFHIEDSLCKLCNGKEYIEKVNFTKMTEKQIAVYNEYFGG